MKSPRARSARGWTTGSGRIPFFTVLIVFVVLVFSILVWYDTSRQKIVEKASSSTTVPKVTYVVKDYVDEIQQANVIIDSQKPEDCENITNPELSKFREMCYYVNALKSMNESVCAGIRDAGLRATCETRIRDRKTGKTRGTVVEGAG